MIYAFQPNTKLYSIDIGRPSFTDEKSRKLWINFYNYVDTSSIKIGINGMYNYIKGILDEKGGYMGGGFAFCFFFETKEDKIQFVSDIKEIGFDYLDYKNISLLMENNQLYVRFTDKFKDKVSQMMVNGDIIGELSVDNCWNVFKSNLKTVLELKSILNEYSLTLD